MCLIHAAAEFAEFASICMESLLDRPPPHGGLAVPYNDDEPQLVISVEELVRAESRVCAGHFMPRDEDIFTYFDKPEEELMEGLAPLASTFEGVPATITTCTVGRKHSLAKNHLKGSGEIAELLNLFIT